MRKCNTESTHGKNNLSLTAVIPGNGATLSRPTKAGVHDSEPKIKTNHIIFLDSGLRRNDGKDDSNVSINCVNLNRIVHPAHAGYLS